MPSKLAVGNYRIHFLAAPSPGDEISPGVVPSTQSSASRLLLPPLSLTDSSSIPSVDLARLGPHQSESMVTWLQALIKLLQRATDSDDFFKNAIHAVVNLFRLDTGRVLLYDKKQGWRTAAEHAQTLPGGRPSPRVPSNRLLQRMRDQKKTVTRQGAGISDQRESLEGLEAVVVSPIFGRDGEVIGALYGDRLRAAGSLAAAEITRADVLLMETLACGVGAGLARLEQQRAAIEAQIRFEQFFTPELAKQLALDPNLLDGRDNEVTLLFCDIRGFSGIVENIASRRGAAVVMDWINDVFGRLSECVLNHDGVLVDYVGDEMIAMWGAPAFQANHAQLACKAAMDIWRLMPEISRHWLNEIGTETRLGIGLNSGLARVGNIGTRRKFKYGALGEAVNICSRVQGATKHLQAGILITDETRSRLDGNFATRRLGLARMVNIKTPVVLHELCADPPPDWPERRRGYDEALHEFERQQAQKAVALLHELLRAFPDDRPAAVLLRRAEALLGHAGAYCHVYDVPR
ncbi:MAG TPA: adenylate/guanylate cyclase domain-containing protein [Pirellulales bacterium]